MQYERYVALSGGTCIKIDNSLSSNVESISFELGNNKRYEDHIKVYNERELMIDGTAYSDNNRLVITNPIINAKAVELTFNINTVDLNDGDLIEGTISIISNVGVLNIPYRYKIIANSLEKTAASLNTIIDYHDYLKTDFVSAKALFTNKEFLKAPFMQDEFTMGLYEGLCKGQNSNIAIIEFFKAFEIDIVPLFKLVDDEIAKKYIDETLDNLDLSAPDGKELSDILSGKQFVSKEKIEDEILNEASYLVDELRDKDLLNALASMCVRNNYIDEIAFKIYLKVIEKGSNLNGIYDKFIHSIPDDYNMKLPLYIYRYYYEAKIYSFDDKLSLYENIISAFDENEDVYKLYREEILEYAISRIYQNKITESLIKIYNKVLSIGMINENNCNNVLYLLRSHKLIVKNKNIRKIIIRYAETEKETKYDVINGIAYIPIFFGSYIMLYEDVYGNRYYSEEVSIKSLFDRKDIENYIIEKYPQKDIVDMTKLIKLNEEENFVNEYEIEELFRLQENMKISSVINNKCKTKIIDFYFNKVIGGDTVNEKARQYLKNIDFESIDLFSKRKLLKTLLDINEYQYVYSIVSLFGIDLMEDDDLVTLFSKCIDYNDINSRGKLLNDLMKFTKNRKKDYKILNYLSNNYEGSIENMILIMDSLSEFSLDEGYIAKKILILCLECNIPKYLDHVYENIDKSMDEDGKLEIAYLNKKATDYVLDDVPTSKEYFDRLTLYITNNFNNIDEMPLIFLLAITKYISTFKILTSNELRRILIKSMEKLLKLDMVFAYFKKLNKHMQMPYYVMNKEYIEFHADKDFAPKAILTISGDPEKKEVELTKVFMNIYIKRITVFKNEVINYEIINGNDPSQGILAKGTLSYDENYEFEYPSRGKMRSTFDYINDAIVNLDRDNIEGLKKSILELTEKQAISKRLFNI